MRRNARVERDKRGFSTPFLLTPPLHTRSLLSPHTRVRSTLPDRTTSLDYAAAATCLVTKARTALRIIGRAPAVVAAAAVAAAAAKEGNAGKAALPLASGGGVAPNVVADAAATTAPATAAAPSDPAPPLLLRVRTRKGAEVTVAPVWGEGGKLGQCLVVVQGGEVGGAGGAGVVSDVVVGGEKGG